MADMREPRCAVIQTQQQKISFGIGFGQAAPAQATILANIRIQSGHPQQSGTGPHHRRAQAIGIAA